MAAMRATVMYGAGDVRVENVPDPTLTEPTDAVVRVLRSCICGSDLWPYRSMPATTEGRRMGHEFLGVVEDTGADVSGVKKDAANGWARIVQAGGLPARRRWPCLFLRRLRPGHGGRPGGGRTGAVPAVVAHSGEPVAQAHDRLRRSGPGRRCPGAAPMACGSSGCASTATRWCRRSGSRSCASDWATVSSRSSCARRTVIRASPYPNTTPC